MSRVERFRPLTYRSLFISDVHLGSRGCQAGLLLDLLHSTRCETLYLVGDIVDFWSMRRKGLYWPQAHNDVLRTLLEKSRDGTRVVYVPGNHDQAFRECVGLVFGRVEIRRHCIHVTADGRRLLVTHGDEYDGIVRCSPLRSRIGSRAYESIIWLNHHVNTWRRRFGYDYWSLASFLKRRVGNALRYIAEFEHALAQAARRQGVDGVVCGHIHRPGIREVGGVLYCNDGDWVENCTAIAEHRDGRLELLDWAAKARREAAADAPALEPAA